MTSTLLVAVTILSSSFFGSWHCAGMCGPIASIMGQRKSLWSYHIGRLIAYVSLGAAAGYLGQFFLSSEFIALRWVSSFLLALILIASGFYFIFPLALRQKIGSFHFSQSIFKLLKKIQAFQIGHSGFVVGLLTAFLPCGWLYTYLTAAIATQSPLAGAATLGLFWLGGLPALSALPLMIRKALSEAGLRQQRIAGSILIFAGLYSLFSFFFLH